ncbi:MAG: hypothetical protein EBR82_79130 [Caulobacteraceae bacterium]|nr:hypothetical protein [Caulobacteraceae bacterium]
MDVLLWSGTGGNRSFTSLDMSPDFVWVKQRNVAFSTGHQIYDIVRGAGSEKELNSSGTGAEGAGNIDQYGWISSFDSNGFSVTAGPVGSDYVNASGYNYVAWCWDAGSSTVSNTQGSITSTVRANATAGFSVVTYTGTGSNATVGHGLGVAPGFIIVKARSRADSWRVYHSALGATKYITLESTAAAGTASTVWNNTAPTSSVFSIGTESAVNTNTATQVAYCFAPVVGYSSFGSYTGNGSADGPFVYTGFRPRWLLTKVSAGDTGSWRVYDAARNTYNALDAELNPNSSGAEYTASNSFDFLSNGFKVRTSNINNNFSGATFIYAAFAEMPFNYSRAR